MQNLDTILLRHQARPWTYLAMEVVDRAVAGATVEKAFALIALPSMPSASLIKKRSTNSPLAQPSISLSTSDRQRCCFLMCGASEKAPQGIDKRFASFDATKEGATTA